jgi:hypothetical protein
MIEIATDVRLRDAYQLEEPWKPEVPLTGSIPLNAHGTVYALHVSVSSPNRRMTQTRRL